MNGIFFKILIGVSNLLGAWFFGLVARCIATGYFLFSPRRKESVRFYKILFSEKGHLFHLWYTFQQYQNFTTIHFDRFLASRKKMVNHTSEGWDHLENVIGKQGGILLMSHLGNWEMAASLLKQKKDELQLLLYMGVKQKEGVEKLQKEDLRKAGVTILGVDQEDNSPFNAVEGIRFLREGGLVSMAGDIVWRSDQRRVKVNFLDHIAYLPEAPFVFSLVSKAPLFVFFAFRTGNNTYHFSLSDPIAVEAHSRADRQIAIGKAAQQYADLLVESLRSHPCEWYHFDRFLHLS
jgi:predicted LPLAT superfamily acyltransferase